MASRIEQLTWQYETPLIVSGDLVAAVRQGGREASLLAGFAESASSEVRGRRAPVPIWLYDASARQSAAPADTV